MHLDLIRIYNTVLKQFEGSSSKHYYTKTSIKIINLNLWQNRGKWDFGKQEIQ